MADFASQIAQHQDLPERKQVQAGKAIAGQMQDEHDAFLKTVIGMLDRNEIDTWKPETFLKKDVYDALNPEWKAKVDKALVNIADQLRLIENFFRSKQTPNESPHLETMIEHLWQMKQRIEEHFDVFKF
jgi:hypothetical protein